jgi:pimeloyl-ACP methyl ester carboxylesterase
MAARHRRRGENVGADVRDRRDEAIRQLRDLAERAGLDPLDVVLPTTRHIVLDGMRFHYLDWTGPVPPVLLLHGGGLTAHTWDLTCVGLRKRHRCLALDQRGHGDSEWSPEVDYSREAHARDLQAFVDTLWLDRYVLVGQSMGAMNALVHAARNPGRVLALVMIDAGPNVQMEGVDRITEFTRSSGQLASIEEYVERAVAFNPRRDPMVLRRSILHNLRQHPDGRWAWKWDPRRPRTTYALAKEWLADLWSDVDRVACPTLVVRGAESDVFTGDQAAELARRFRDGRRVSVEGAGHNVQGDNARGLIEVTEAFIDGVVAGES